MVFYSSPTKYRIKPTPNLWHKNSSLRYQIMNIDTFDVVQPFSKVVITELKHHHFLLDQAFIWSGDQINANLLFTLWWELQLKIMTMTSSNWDDREMYSENEMIAYLQLQLSGIRAITWPYPVDVCSALCKWIVQFWGNSSIPNNYCASPASDERCFDGL